MNENMFTQENTDGFSDEELAIMNNEYKLQIEQYKDLEGDMFFAQIEKAVAERVFTAHC